MLEGSRWSKTTGKAMVSVRTPAGVPEMVLMANKKSNHSPLDHRELSFRNVPDEIERIKAVKARLLGDRRLLARSD
jgi:hypothetical protein